VTAPGADARAPSHGLVLSLFPGADLLGRGFEAEGFCVVRGPDLVWGGDVRSFRAPAGHFEGVIGGSPCQDFSQLRRTPPTGDGLAMLAEFVRVVSEADPVWFLLENVPRVPCVAVAGYSVQRFNLRADECGGAQRRNRCFQFGSRDSSVLVCDRSATARATVQAALATAASRRDCPPFARFCELQGLPSLFDLPGLSRRAKYRAVGNGVPVYMARVIARAVTRRGESRGAVLCACGCGRLVAGLVTRATPACRKRIQRARAAGLSVAA
jgi:DNA (cytosine-5)-methyltransferase 1